MTHHTNGGAPDDVTQLPTSTSPPPEPPPTPATGLHGIAITAMAACALLGICLLFALITVGWGDGPRRIVIALFVITSIAFMASAMTAIFAAARDSAPRRETSAQD